MKSKYVRLSLCIVMALLLLTGTALAADRGIEYTINRLLIRDCATMEELYEIPQDLFLAEAEITNDSSAEVDAVMLVQYSSDGQMIGMQYLYTRTHVGETSVFGAMMDNRDGSIGCIKAFVVPAVGNMVPLAESVTYGEQIEVEPMPDPEPDPKPEPVPGVYTNAVKSGTIYADLGLTQSTWATVIRNGEMMGDFQLKLNSTTKIGGNGVLIEAVKDENGEITLYITDYYLGKVEDVLGDEVTIEVFGHDGIGWQLLTVDMVLQEDEYVLLTIMDGNIMTIEPVTTVSGTLESIGAASTYTILDGVQYRHSMHLDQNNPNAYTVKFNAEMNLLLDKFGYMIGLQPAKVEEVLDGYVLVTDSEFEAGGLAASDKALVEVLHLDGTGYEVLNLQTKRTGSDSARITKFLNEEGSWETLSADSRIEYGFYGYTMTENGEIVLKTLSKTRPNELCVLPGTVKAEGKQQFVFGDDTRNLVLDNDSVMHLVTDKGVETIEGYKNIRIDEFANALVIYKGRTVIEVFVIDGNTVEKDIFAYYNGDEFRISGSKTYIPMYVNGELQYYTYSYDLPITMDMPQGVYLIALEGSKIVKMDCVLTEDWAMTTVASVRSDGTAFTAYGSNVNEDNATYADGVQIYDLTQDGLRVEAVAEGDRIVYINNSAARGEVVTHIWIVKHYAGVIEPEEPDTGDEEVLDGYVLVTDSECERGSLGNDTALIEVLNLDGTGYEVFSLPTRRTTMDGQQVTQYKNPYGEWVVISRDERDMIPFGFYGYTMTDNGEIELKALSETGASELEVLPGMVRADGKQEFIFGDDAHNLVLNRDSLMHLVTEKGVETIEGYQNMEIDEAAVNALVIYGGRTVREVFVVNGSLIEKDIYAYYNGTEFQISGSKTYIPMYVDGELQYYTFANITVGGGIDTMINEELPDGVYKIDLEGNRIVAMDSVLTEWESMTIVTSVSSTGKYFNVAEENNVTYADGVEIYDLPKDGVRVEAVAKGDTILYLKNSVDKGEVATHIWIVKHYKRPTIVNDAPVEEAPVMDYTMSVAVEGDTATIEVTGDLPADAFVDVMVWENGQYAYAGCATWVGVVDGVHTYEFVNDLPMDYEFVFELFVNGAVLSTEPIFIPQ